MANPIDRLDEEERRIQAEIRAISGRFNNINKHFRDVMKFIIEQKRVFLSLSDGPIKIEVNYANDPQNFKRAKLQWEQMVKNKIENEINPKIYSLRPDCEIFKAEIERVKALLQAQVRDSGGRLGRVDSDFVNLLDDAEKHVQAITNELIDLGRHLLVFEGTFIIEPNGSNRVNFSNNSLRIVHDTLDRLHFDLQRHMVYVLKFYQFQFKRYRKTRLS